MNAYEQKLQARRERLEDAADRAKRDGEARLATADRMASCIPFGQPILVGHYSEGRDRRFRERIRNNTSKGFAALDQAKALAARAASVGTGGVSSDDPEAVAKLRDSLAERESMHTRMLAANKIIRARGLTQDERIARLVAGGMSEGAAAEMLKPDRFGGMGYAGYQLSNNGAEIRRLRKRIAHLEAQATKREAAEPAADTRVGDVIVRRNVEINRLQLIFPGKPCDAVRAKLKGNGFRWSPIEGAWQRHLNASAEFAARCVLGE